MLIVLMALTIATFNVAGLGNDKNENLFELFSNQIRLELRCFKRFILLHPMKYCGKWNGEVKFCGINGITRSRGVAIVFNKNLKYCIKNVYAATMAVYC